MIVKPRKVSPGWLLRWPKEAFQLMSRAWILWMGTAALLGAASQWLPPVVQLLLWPVGLFTFTLSTGLAKVSDVKFVTGEDLVQTFSSAVRLMTTDLINRRIQIVLTTALFILLSAAHKDAAADIAGAAASQVGGIGPSDLFKWLFSPESPLSNAGPCMWVGVWLQASGILLPGFSGCLRQTFGDLDDETLRNLTFQAARTNRAAVVGIQAFGMVLALASVTLPVIGWALGVFLPVLAYVAFREMFVDGNGNRERAPRTVSSRISQTAADAA